MNTKIHSEDFSKAFAFYRGTFRYNSRQDFISDLCKKVQSLLKSWSEKSKELGYPVKEQLFNYTFEIWTGDKNRLNHILEEWVIQLCIGEVITVNRCLQRDYEHLTKVEYFGEEVRNGKDDTEYNKVHNITEFRTFLNRECLGLGVEPKEPMNKDSIIFNFLIVLLERTDWESLNSKSFRDYVCNEVGMKKEYYDILVKEYWGD